MYAEQFVCGQVDEIATCEVMNKKTKWKNLLDLLPHPNVLISCDSMLDKFVKWVPQITPMRLHVHTRYYLPMEC